MEQSVNIDITIPRKLQATGLALLITGVVFGFAGSLQYLAPGLFEEILAFEKLRPLHVSSVVFWILLSATGTAFIFLQDHRKISYTGGRSLGVAWSVLIFTIPVIMFSYLSGKFGGREYWEFPPYLAVPLLLSWILIFIAFTGKTGSILKQPVYVWMWVTGFTFLVFTFMESYLWTIPWFRSNIINDMTIQWKSNGSIVGSWNMLIYGSGLYVMDRIRGDNRYSHSKMAFGLYFLGLFNLMFNWGHHIYTLPTHSFVKHIGYAVSMTELLILGKIIWGWKSSLGEAEKFRHITAYRFLLAADLWIFLNLSLAIIMSVPAFNLFTHGTMITVAHAMGTTIGINTMMLFAFITFIYHERTKDDRPPVWLKRGMVLSNIALVVFWLSLIGAGYIRSRWNFEGGKTAFAGMMENSKPAFLIFGISGFVLLAGLLIVASTLLKRILFHPSISNNKLQIT